MQANRLQAMLRHILKLACLSAGSAACFAAGWAALTAPSAPLNALTAPQKPVHIAGPIDPATGVRTRRGSPDSAAPTDRLGDALPADVLMRLGTVRFRHLSAVVKVTFSPDGKM